MGSWGAATSSGDMNCSIANFPPAICKGFLSHFGSKAVVLRAHVSMGSETHTRTQAALKVAIS